MKEVFAAAVLYVSTVLGFSQSIAENSLDKWQEEVLANPRNSVAHFHIGEILMLRQNYQSAANEFREALNGDLNPKWTEVLSHIDLGRIFEITGQHERSVNEYTQARKTNDNTRGALERVAEYLKQAESGYDLPAPAGVSRVGNGVIEPEPIERTEPEYSEEGLRAGLEGTVLLAGVIAEDGSAHNLRVVREIGLGLDEKAIEAVKRWRFAPGSYQGKPAPVFASIPVDFFLPAKRSRWHLIQATFRPPEGASRPTFASAKYPVGAGIGPSAMDEGGILVAVGRQAMVRVSFDVDKQGNPVHFQVQKASEEVWGGEAIALVHDWRFTPGEKNGVPISVPCTLDLVWGERNLTRSVWARLRAVADAQSSDSGGGIDVPTVIYKLDPSYSEEARNAKLEGTVVVSLVVGEDGAPRDMRIVKALGLGLDEKAIESLAAWRFRPAFVNGQPAPVAVNVEVNFRLR